MAFEYGCFISYRHLPKIEPFVRRLAKDIKNELDLYGIKQLNVFFDEERIKPGDNFNALIPGSLCKTIVMVVIYVPDYFTDQKPYCTKEFVAFIEHEKRRLAEIVQKYPEHDPAKLHQVIPILLKKPLTPLPEALTANRNAIDWSEKTALENPAQFAKNKAYISAVWYIRDKILTFWHQIPQLDVLADCSNYANLPDEQHPLFQKLVQPQSPVFP